MWMNAQSITTNRERKKEREHKQNNQRNEQKNQIHFNQIITKDTYFKSDKKKRERERKRKFAYVYSASSTSRIVEHVCIHK